MSGMDQSQQKLVNEAVLPSTFSSYRGNLEEAQKRDNGWAGGLEEVS